MSIQITISEDVINSVVRPISLFLNDIKEGSMFTHVMLDDGDTYEKTESNQLPTFHFISSEGGMYKFKAYDLHRLNCDGKSFKEYFIPQLDKQCLLQPSFKVIKCEPLLGDNKQKMYPYFAFKGYDDYCTERDRINEVNKENKANGNSDVEYIDKKVKDRLLLSGIQDRFIDRYYRVLDIDKEIFYYE